MFLSIFNQVMYSSPSAIEPNSPVTSPGNIVSDENRSLGWKVNVRASKIDVYLLSIDGKPLISDGVRQTTSTELPNVTVTVLHIVASRPSDSGRYRCSDGHSLQSKEAKLSLRDGHLHSFLRSLSSVSSPSIFSSSFRTVLSLFIVLSFFRRLE